ncbi:MAG: cation-transporting P-type ATPase [Ruminococcaceae bacterium]|nr:cation-transporting P-type ATPase [Oscillospiraceae bacterium]
MALKNAWHTMETKQIVERLESDAAAGLTRKQARSRAAKLNIRQPEARQPLFLPAKKPLSRYLAKMLLDPIMILTLLVAAIVFFFEQYALGGSIIFIMLCNAVFCAFAYAKANDVRNTMQLYSNPMVKVIRGGKLFTTDARNVVPGDLVVLTCGDVCPADIRLEKGSSLRVTQFVLGVVNHKRQMLRTTVNKSGDRIYLPNETVMPQDCENIVYAGSVIEQGFAKGIAVETGKYTYIGAVRGTVPGTEREKEPESIAFIRRYFLRFSMIQAILLIPLTVVMTVTLRETLSFEACFLTALALCCTAIAEHIVALAEIVRATGIDSAASQKENASLAIVKNSLAADRLCEMTDLLLFDSSAISDGKYHLESVYAGGSIYNQTELINPDVYRLASDLYLYRSAARPPEFSEGHTFDAGLGGPIDALINHVKVDKDAIELTRSASYLTFEKDACISHNQTKQGEYDVIITQNEQMLQSCTLALVGNDTKPFDDSEHIALRTLCRIYRESGYRILLVMSRSEQSVTLVGVLAFAPQIGYGFLQCSEELLASGVRVSAFLPDTPENMKILNDSGLVRDELTDVLRAMRAEDEGLDLHVAYGSYRAYLGFSKTQIADLIEKLRERGNCTASYCVDNAMQKLHEMTDLRISCDSMEYRSDKVAESLYEKMPLDGKPFSERASQNTRRTSDIILRRAGKRGGGLHGVLTGRKYAFAINHNLANMMTYLITVQIFRILLVTLPALFGTLTLSAVSLMISGLIFDVAAVILFSFASPNQSALCASYPIMRRLEKPIAYNTANVISACVSALFLWMTLVVLQIFDVLNPSACAGLCFVSTALLQGTVFAVTLYEYSTKKKGRIAPLHLVMLGGYLIVLAICTFVPGLNTLTGTANIPALSLLLTPIAALVYYVMYRILSAKGLNLHK